MSSHLVKNAFKDWVTLFFDRNSNLDIITTKPKHISKIRGL